MAVSGNPRAKQAWDFFTSRGYSAAQTAGIIGNLIGESGLDPLAKGDGGLATGLAQHHPDRWAAHLTRTSAAGTDPNDFDAQLDFIDWEVRNKEQKAFNRLMKAGTVDEATAAFIGFERAPKASPGITLRVAITTPVASAARRRSTSSSETVDWPRRSTSPSRRPHPTTIRSTTRPTR